jgi:hypothetical protein
MTVPGLPVLDPGDAEIYGWRVAPDREGNLIIEVIDGVGSIVFPPGGHLTHNGNGDIKARVVMTDLEGSVDQDGNAWLSSDGKVTDEKVSLTPNIHAIIFAPGGFLRWEGGKLLHQGIEFAGRINPGPAEPVARNS